MGFLRFGSNGDGIGFAQSRVNIIRSLIKAGARMALFADMVPGRKYQKLSPRTLPNGIKNSDTIQRVSGDVVLTAADVGSVSNQANVTLAILSMTVLNGMIDIGINDRVAKKLESSKTTPLNNGTIDSAANIYKHYINIANWVVIMPLGTTLAQAQDFVNGMVIRYQLATPIDTLNTPPLTQWVDCVGERVSKNLLDRMACTENVLLTWATSATSAETNSIVTPFIPVSEGTQYTGKYNAQVLFFDSAQQYIGALQSNGTTVAKATGTSFATFTVPTGLGIAYVRLGIRTSYNGGGNMVTATDHQFSKGATLPQYEPYGVLPPNNATLQGFANTETSGMAYVPLVCETGTPVEYANGTVKNVDFTTTSNIVFGDGASATVLNGKIIATGNGTKATIGVDNQPLNATLTGSANKSYYVEFTAKVPSGATSVTVGTWDGSNTRTVTSPTAPIADKELTYGGVVTQVAAGATTLRPILRAVFADAATANGKVVEITNFMITPITDNPQITALESQMSNPLTALECDRIFPFVPTTGVSKIGIRPLMVFDGINDYGVLANNPSVDIVGTGDFAIAVGFLTPSVMNNNQIICKNLDSAANIQYSINSLLDGQIIVYLNGTPIQVVGFGQVLPNNMYDLRIYRINGRLIAKLQNVEKSNQANTTALLSQPNLRLGARSSIADGSTNTAFFKGGLAWAIIATGAEVANLDKALDRKARDYRMMG